MKSLHQRSKRRNNDDERSIAMAVRAGLVTSVASGYALARRQRAPWIAAEDDLATFDLADSVAGRREFVERLDGRAREEEAARCGVPELPEDSRLSHLRRGWYWGTQAFAEKMLALAEEVIAKPRSRPYRSGGVKRSHDEKEAQRIVREGMERNGLSAEELEWFPGSDPRKLAIAMEVRENTAVSLDWIDQTLRMRSAANVSQQLRRLKSVHRAAHVP